MLLKALFALLVFESVTFAASANYLASVSCNADGSAPVIVSGSTANQGLYRSCIDSGSAGIAEVSSGNSGPTQDVTPTAYSVAGTTTPNYVVTTTSISDPTMSIIDTGLTSGTPLNVQETWSATGYYGYQQSNNYQPNPNGISSIGGYLQVSVDGTGPNTYYVQPTGCLYGVSFCNLQGYGGGLDTLNVTSLFQTTVGATFSSTVSLYAIAGASGGAEANITFYNYRLISSPVQLSSLMVTNANTGQAISSAVLEGSSGPYGIVAPVVPEIDANSAAGAIALMAGILLIYAGRSRRLLGGLPLTSTEVGNAPPAGS